MRFPVAALLALAVAALLAAPAAAGSRDFRIGVTDAAGVGQADMAGMGAVDAGVFRVNFSWVHIESGTPAPPARRCNATWETESGVQYDWRQHDQIVSRASRQGVRLLPVIVGAPSYASRRSAQAPYTGDPREIEAYRCFVRALVDRYGRGGEYFRTPAPEGDPSARPITDWQVWNEPNLVQFSTDELGVDPREYARLVKVTSAQIRQQDPRATVALAGLPEVTNGFSPPVFLRRFYGEPRIEGKFDVVSLHPYARNYRGVEGAVLRVRRVLKRVGDRRRYIWITETGWATDGNGLGFLVKSPKGQARQLKKTFRTLRENRRRWNIGTVSWFRWRDQARPAENKGTFDYTGLYRKGGSPKPACRRFVRFTNGRCPTLP